MSLLTFVSTTSSFCWHQYIHLVLFDILLGGWWDPFIIKLSELKWFKVHLNSNVSGLKKKLSIRLNNLKITEEETEVDIWNLDSNLEKI